MTSEGKTIAWIEEEPIGEYGVALIHFTDGTALKIEGASYEEVDLSFDELSSTQVRAAARLRMGHRERKRLERLKRQEWLSISCEERATRRERERARRPRSPFGDVLAEQYRGFILDQIRDLSRLGFGEQQTVRKSCSRCGEVECENAVFRREGDAAQ